MPWIKLEHSTLTKPEIFSISRELGISKGDAFYLCVKFWCWCDDNCVDHFVTNCGYEDVDHIVTHPGFCAALARVGWVSITPSGEVVSVPNFERHNGRSAKKRAQNAKKQANWRGDCESTVDRSVDQNVTIDGNKKVTREEKIRLDKSNKNIPQPPFDVFAALESRGIASAPIRGAVERWLAYKAERRESYKPAGLAGLVGRIAAQIKARGEAAVVERIDRAIANGWRGWDFAADDRQTNGAAKPADEIIPFGAGWPEFEELKKQREEKQK